MGLRTASVRRPHVAVMAPALTDSSQPTNFKLVSPEEAHLELASPINNFRRPCVQQQLKRKPLPDSSGASDNTLTNPPPPCIMSSPLPMADEQTMGLHKSTAGLDDLHDKSKASSDVDQLFADDLLQAFKSHNDNLDVFSTPGELTSLERELLDDVGNMMNLSLNESELEAEVDLKESQAQNDIGFLRKRNVSLERQLDFLRRRVAKLQTKRMGQHISDEIMGVFEYVNGSLKRDTASAEADVSKPMSVGAAKILTRKLEMTSAQQAINAGRQKPSARYFGSGSLESTSTFRSSLNGTISVPLWPVERKKELAKVAGMLKTELCIVQNNFDSEATDSSSGGESCDEMQTYNNNHQQYLSIEKRALWKFTTERASIAARWTWLQAQIADLECRIRQHTELYKRVRARKGLIKLHGPSPPPIHHNNNTSLPNTVNGYRGTLPGNPPEKLLESGAATTTANGSSCPDYQCARTRPLVGMRKRKLLQLAGLHAISKKAARPTNVRCGCAPPEVPSCALCTGRTDPTYPRDPPGTMSRSERIAMVDPGFHPVFSLPEDTSQSIHFDAIMKTAEWQQRSARMKSTKIMMAKTDRVEKTSLEHRTKKLDHRKKFGRLLKPSTISALSAKIKNRNRKAGRHSINRLNKRRRTAKMALSQLHSLSADGADEEVEAAIGNNTNTLTYDSPNSSPLLHTQTISGYNRRNRSDSYDIDNIVIPYSVAASTRVEKLQYKEILTPKWRIADPESANSKYENKNNGVVKGSSQGSDGEEDMSEEAVIARHDRCEYDERKKFQSYVRPSNYGRPRSNKRTDSRAESSGANTPDAMSPHPVDHQENTHSPITSPPATPLSLQHDEPLIPTTSATSINMISAPLPILSVSALRRRTISQTRFGRERQEVREEVRCNTPEAVEVAPFERRVFPLSDETFGGMLQHMPEDHQFKTNIRAQDSNLMELDLAYIDRKVGSPDSESTESALGDEDPNDPEWFEIEEAPLPRDRFKR